MDKIRVGTGFDVHRLVEGRKLIIGGVTIPFEKGLLGHSDADVLVHAISDALLGAAGLPAIGHYFPPSDPTYKDADSMALLAQVRGFVENAGYGRIVNIDATIIAERPKMLEHVPAMRKNIAGILGIPEASVGIKATTSEKLGFVGREEGIAANAICLIADV
jgi:2-C-methyl-D-erythritol 2,4-cyclodiphosphate synthase